MKYYLNRLESLICSTNFLNNMYINKNYLKNLQDYKKMINANPDKQDIGHR